MHSLGDSVDRSLYLIMAVVYISRGKPLCFTTVLYYSSSSSFQTLISEVTERIPFILSHNIRSGCNLIMHPQEFVDLYPHSKITPKLPKMGISETESDIRWRITLQRNFTSTIAALVHYQGSSSVNTKSAWTLTPNEGLVWVNIWHPIIKFGTPLISLEL